MPKEPYLKKTTFSLHLAITVLAVAAVVAIYSVYQTTWGGARTVFQTIKSENTYAHACIMELEAYEERPENLDQWYIHIKNKPEPTVLAKGKLLKVIDAKLYNKSYEVPMDCCVIHQDVSAKTKFLMPNQYGPREITCRLPYDRTITDTADKIFVHEDEDIVEFIIDDTWYCAPMSRVEIQNYNN